MQGRIQKWVDHSISVTINLPNDATEELVSQLYMEAWKSGCKGVTIYRDGSRAGVLVGLKKDEKKETENTYNATKLVRPKVLECDIIRFQNKKEKWIAFVGLKEGRPFEIFTGLADEESGIMLPKSVTKGYIIRAEDINGNKRYDFQYKNKLGYATTMEGLSHKFDQEYWNYAKLISGILRYGMPIEQAVNVVSDISMDSESINTWKSGVERALKRYIQDGTSMQEMVCPECGQKTIVVKEGCFVCNNCGYAQCGG